MLHKISIPYASRPPDFAELARVAPDFKPFLRTLANGKSTIDYRDERAVRALSLALLRRDFNLVIDLPTNRLCPMVPSRVEYIVFMLRICQMDTTKSSSEICGLDIGTGASAIYPLLATRLTPTVSFLASDIDEFSLECARCNVELNDLDRRIKVLRTRDEEPLFTSVISQTIGDSDIHFTMCNPPFYASQAEIEVLAKEKNDPFAVCTGGENEMITRGGEVAFITRMIEESLAVGHQIRIFSSLIGKFSSIEPLIAQLNELGIGNYILHTLSTGQTTRHILIWSLGTWRLPQHIAHYTPYSRKYQPRSSTFTFTLPQGLDVELACNILLELLNDLDDVTVKQETEAEADVDEEERLTIYHSTSMIARCYRIITVRNTWSRAARRQAQRAERAPPQQADAGMEKDTSSCSNIPPLHIEATFKFGNGAGESYLRGEWIRGPQVAWLDWSKLWAFVTRKLNDEVKRPAVDFKGSNQDTRTTSSIPHYNRQSR